MFGFYNSSTGQWLDNNFQTPHFDTIDALIAVCYPSREAFLAKHGEPSLWTKQSISQQTIQAVLRTAAQQWTMPKPPALLDPLYLSQRIPEENLR